MSASRFMGKVASIALGVALAKALVAAYHGSHDARVGLASVGATALVVAFAFWCYWGDEK